MDDPLTRKISGLHDEPGGARPDQLLDICTALLLRIQELEQGKASLTEGQAHLDGRVNKLEAAKLYVEPRG